MINMSDFSTAKEQQTAYQRWEMASFGSADESKSKRFNHVKSKEETVQTSKMTEAFEVVRKEAFHKGVQEGFAVGLAKAKEMAEKDRQQFLAMASAFQSALEFADAAIEQNILELALDIAKAMLKVQLKVDPACILPVVMDAIHYLPDVQKPARILVHHEDARILREYLAEELSSQVWQIQEDPQIERGGCIVETGANHIDASNEMRWKRISEALAHKTDWLLPCV